MNPNKSPQSVAERWMAGVSGLSVDELRAAQKFRGQPLLRAREAYATGKISLGDFEAKVSLILRGESVG